MGLDWNPLGKPKSGFEQEFFDLLGQLTEPKAWLQPSPIPHRPIADGQDTKSLRQRLFSIQISPYETLGAPRVGRDPAADAWIRAQYGKAPNRPPSIDDWVRQFQGYYAIALVPENDGLPFYSGQPLGGERWTFRAKFLEDCLDVLGEPLFNEAWLNHTPAQTADYGDRLMRLATEYAEATDTHYVLSSRRVNDAILADNASPAHKAHIIASAARWVAFWSSRGHGMMADY